MPIKNLPFEPVLNYMVAKAVFTQGEADRYLIIWPLLSNKERAQILSSFFKLLRAKSLSPMLNWQTPASTRTVPLSDLEILAALERSWCLERED